MKCLFAIVFCALLASVAPAALLPPVDPILPGTDHSNEDHSGHGHVLENVIAPGAAFRSARLAAYSSNLSGADLRGSSYDDLSLANCNLTGANFSGANLGELTVQSSNLRGAIFRDSIFGPALFILTDFRDSDLREIDFSGFDFRSTRFLNVDMRGVNLRGTNIDSLIYSVDALATVTFDATTIYDAQTIFPADFNPVAAGLTFVPEPSSCITATIGVALLIVSHRNRRWPKLYWPKT